jgi:predicted nucleic acid-binding protein
MAFEALWDTSAFFADCSSIVIARELSLRRVLTTDRHFQVCGFESPLLP